MRPLAYSLIRMSTTGQTDGDSFRRQFSPQQAFCDKRGWELDLSLHHSDIRKFAVSAYKDLAKTPFAKFVLMVEAGVLPKGRQLILLIEDIDRASRGIHDQAYDFFLRLMRAGVWLCTTSDGEIYTLDGINTDEGKRHKLQYKLDAAHDYSEKLRVRVGASWEARRARAAAGEVIATEAGPDWLDVIDEKYLLNPVHQATVKLVNHEGRRIGKRAVAKLLNSMLDIHPPFRGQNGWHASAVQRILESRASFGECTFRRVENGKRTAVQTIRDYYPACITETDFLLTREAVEGRRHIGPVHKGGRFNTMLSGLLRCSCGGVLHYVNKSRGNEYFVCNAALRNMGCDNHRHYEHRGLEFEILTMLMWFDVSRIIPQPDRPISEVAAIEAQIQDKAKRADWLAESGEPNQFTRRTIDKLVEEIAGLRERLDQQRRSALASEARQNAHEEFVTLVDEMLRARACRAPSPQAAADPDDEQRKILRGRISTELHRIIAAIQVEGGDLIVQMQPVRHWQFGFRLAASRPYQRGQKVEHKLSGLIIRCGDAPAREIPLTLDNIAHEWGWLEQFRDGSALSQIEQKIGRVDVERVTAMALASMAKVEQ